MIPTPLSVRSAFSQAFPSIFLARKLTNAFFFSFFPFFRDLGNFFSDEPVLAIVAIMRFQTIPAKNIFLQTDTCVLIKVSLLLSADL